MTKSALVTRDIDILSGMASWQGVSVFLSITTLDGKLARRMEPRAPQPTARLAAIRALSDAAVPCGVLVGPVIPGLTDQELPEIVAAAADHGATFAGYTMLRLPYGVADLFTEWLHEHVPEQAEKVMSRVRLMRDGKRNSSTFHERMRGTGIHAELTAKLFATAQRRHGFGPAPTLNATRFRRLDRRQPELFDETT